jgi:hypothetical protein
LRHFYNALRLISSAILYQALIMASHRPFQPTKKKAHRHRCAFLF